MKLQVWRSRVPSLSLISHSLRNQRRTIVGQRGKKGKLSETKWTIFNPISVAFVQATGMKEERLNKVKFQRAAPWAETCHPCDCNDTPGTLGAKARRVQSPWWCYRISGKHVIILIIPVYRWKMHWGDRWAGLFKVSQLVSERLGKQIWMCISPSWWLSCLLCSTLIGHYENSCEIRGPIFQSFCGLSWQWISMSRKVDTSLSFYVIWPE